MFQAIFDGVTFNSGRFAQNCGGSTSDVRLKGGDWNNFEYLNSRINE